MKKAILIILSIFFALISLIFLITSLSVFLSEESSIGGGIGLLVLSAIFAVPILIFNKESKRIDAKTTNPSQQQSVSKKKKFSIIPYELEQIDGYRLAYHYNNVDVCCINAVPREAVFNNKLYFAQESTNVHDNKAVAIILIPQRKKLGYLYRGKLQDMANDYIRRGDKIRARITYVNILKKEVKMSLSFYKKI